MNQLLRRQWSLSVGTRLLIGVVPSLLSMALVVALLTWSEYGRQAPAAFIGAAVALAIGTLVHAALNIRYFVRRFDRITELIAAEQSHRAARSGASRDEFDRIEEAMGALGTALSRSEAARAHADARSESHLREQSTLLAALVRDSLARLDDVRLPLHLLLDTPFGELNENQEELLRDAREAADAIDGAIRRLGQIADADRDALPAATEMVQVNDVVRAIVPLLRASVERVGARLELDLEPGLPRLLLDRARLAEALSLFGALSAQQTAHGAALQLATRREGRGVSVHLTPWRPAEATQLDPALATRLISGQGGHLRMPEGALEVQLGVDGVA